MALRVRCLASAVAAATTGLALTIPAFAEEAGKRIEEIVVTAEKREATVSDTSISITAFGEDMIEDFGIQGADELVNFIPSTTRDAYDIRIRGVGRNFRALGGDPGVATYYNGVYSEDFGIAASENGLYDVQRVEVLRGPQGTLYGRNAIGGALNYISNQPSYETEAELRGLFGNYGAREYYGVLSGPLVADRLAYRLVALRRDRDGYQDGLAGEEDINSIGDQNISVAFNWRIADNWEANVRWNDRASDRIIGQGSLVTEGAGSERGVRSTNILADGLVADPNGPISFTDPVTGATVRARHPRPGIDVAARTNVNGTYFGTDPSVDIQGQFFDPDTEDLEGWVATNSENDEVFDHNAVQFDLTWDINETTSLKYLGGWMDFDYTYDIDLDYTSGTLSQYRQTVLEAVETHSHELQLLWQIGDSLQMTSGVYYFNSDRLQNYAFRDAYNQGRYTRAANYGAFAPFLPNPHVRRGDAPVGAIVVGRWEGDSTGSPYEYWNTVETDAYAAYTQGTFTFNEHWALTLGIRYAKDEKSAFEERTGYFEQSAVSFVGPNPGCGVLIGQPAGALPCSAIGLTPLAWANVIMGNAIPTGNPANPILSTCADGFADPDCTTPVRLQGVPLSFADSAEGEDEWSDVTYRVNLDWTPNEDTLIYASVTTGYRAGGYSLGIGDSREATPSGRVPLTYDQEEVMAYEVGYKGTLLDGRMQFNASWYLYDYDNYQDRVEQYNPGSQGSVDVVVNADSAENMGVEFEATWLATDNWTIGGNYSWADTEYTSDFYVLQDDNPMLPISLFPQGDDTGSPYEPFFVYNLDGNALKRIPEHKATFWTFYDFNFGGAGTLTPGLTYSFTGKYYDSGIERDLDEIPSRNQLDLSVTWRDSADRWMIRGFVDNATDEGSTQALTTSTESSNYRLVSSYLFPRFYGIDVTYRLSHLF